MGWEGGLLGGGGKCSAWLLRSESHFHMMGAVHTLQGTGSNRSLTFLNIPGKPAPGSELRFPTGGWASLWIPHLQAASQAVLLRLEGEGLMLGAGTLGGAPRLPFLGKHL